MLAEGAFIRSASYDAGVGVVKCARWRDAHLLACTGVSGEVTLIDTRSGSGSSSGGGSVGGSGSSGGGGSGGSGGSSPTLGASHSRGAYCVRWSPAQEHILLSVSGLEMLLHDLRAPSKPLHVLRGHSEAKPTDSALSKIFTPTFSHGGRAVSSLGAKSQRLTVLHQRLAQCMHALACLLHSSPLTPHPSPTPTPTPTPSPTPSPSPSPSPSP